MPIHYQLGDDHVAVITIDRPEARNSLDLYHFRDLANAWRRFRDEEEAWVAIITGVEGNFMSGADLKTYIPQITALQKKITTGEVTEIDGCQLRDGTDAVLRSLTIYKPIIAAIDGPCVAGGMEMLGGVDIRIATPRAGAPADGQVNRPRHGDPLREGGSRRHDHDRPSRGAQLPRHRPLRHAVRLLEALPRR